MDDAPDELLPDELLALAGLLRLLIRLDGRFSAEERDALAAVAASVVEARPRPEEGDGAPYRDGKPVEPIAPIGTERFFALIDRASHELPDDEAIRGAARAVVRQQGRETIHALVTFVASADFSPAGELALLDWLAREWNLPH